MQSYNLEIKLKFSKSFPSEFNKIQFGKYIIRAIPQNTRNAGEAILSFENKFESPIGGGSNPAEEAETIYRFISLIYNMRVEKGEVKINNQSVPKKTNIYPQYLGNIDPINSSIYLDKIFYLDDDLARQFFRSFNVYSVSLNYIPSDPTFAFFLLVVSIECLSSQDKIIPKTDLDLDKKKCERFCKFIKDNYPDSLKNTDENDKSLFTELLKTIYYNHRSGFVHGGKQVSSASLMADSVNSSYFKHKINGKETKTPGLGWFAKIVRGSILGFLENLDQPKNINDEDLISRLAFEKAVLNIKVNKDIEKGQIIKSGDIDYR